MTDTLPITTKNKSIKKGDAAILSPGGIHFLPQPKISINQRKADALFSLSGLNTDNGYHIVNEFQAVSLALARWFADAILDHDRFQLGGLVDKYAPIAHSLCGPALAVPFLENGFEGLLFFSGSNKAASKESESPQN